VSLTQLFFVSDACLGKVYAGNFALRIVEGADSRLHRSAPRDQDFQIRSWPSFGPEERFITIRIVGIVVPRFQPSRDVVPGLGIRVSRILFFYGIGGIHRRAPGHDGEWKLHEIYVNWRQIYTTYTCRKRQRIGAVEISPAIGLLGRWCSLSRPGCGAASYGRSLRVVPLGVAKRAAMARSDDGNAA
jgi:hypothetical protein